MKEQKVFIGASVRRKEDPRHLTGKARFVADFNLAGMVHATLVRSQYAHAFIDGIDCGAATLRPEVVLVATAADLGALPPIPVRLGASPSFVQFLQRPLAHTTVRFVGEPIVLVVATDRYVAEDAAELVRINYKPLPVVSDAESVLNSAIVAPHATSTGNRTVCIQEMTGEPDRALAAAEVRIKHRFEVQRHTGVPLETRGLVAAFDEATSRLTVWGSTKVPHFNRHVLSDLLALPMHRIHFIELDVGGGFGIRGEFYPEDFLVPWASMRLGRPVKWVEDRREHFLAANHSRQQVHTIEIGATRDGRLTALVDQVTVDMGAYLRTHGVTVPALTASMLPGPYRIPNYRCDVSCVLTNKTPTGTYRSPGRFEATFVRERMMDLLAEAVGVDVVEIRRRNLITPEEMPYHVGTTTLGHPTVYDVGNYASALDRALDDTRYTELRRSQAEARADGRCLGIGVACVLEKSGLGPWETARVEIDQSGVVVVYTGLASLGQGVETIMAQICAEVLNLPVNEITVVHGDTDLIPYGNGAFASRGTVAGGGAVFLASLALKDKILECAGRLHEVASGDLLLENGRVSVRGAPTKSLTFKELVAASAPTLTLPRGLTPGLSATRFFQVPDMTYPYGTHIAVVELDPDTGQVDLLKYGIAYDVGRAINPTLVEGQIVGGLAQGIGGALLEELAYDLDGQALSTTFMDYLLPTTMEMADELFIAILEETPSPHNPLGVKGAGEGGTAGAGAAIANAVCDALHSFGAEVTCLPLSPSRIRALIEAAGSSVPRKK